MSDPRVAIGRGTYGDPKIVLYSSEDRLSIGNFSSIAGGSTLLAGGEHHYKTTSTFPFHFYSLADPGPEESDPMKIRYTDARYKGPLRIGSDVWIGYGAMVLSGVTIGHGAVIGAGAVVGSDVPPFSVAVGSPWKLARKRFDEGTIAALLEIRWWDWDPAVILRYMPLLLGDPKEFLAAVDSLGPDELAGYYTIDPSHDEMEFESIPAPVAARPSLARRIIRGIVPPILSRGARRIRSGIGKSLHNSMNWEVG